MKWTPALRDEYLKKIRWLLVIAIFALILLLISVWLHNWLLITMSLAPLGGAGYNWWILREHILGRK